LAFVFAKKARRSRLGSGKTLSELHDIHCKTNQIPSDEAIYDHAGCTENCKDFTVSVKVIDVIKKQITTVECNYRERKCC